MSRLIRSTIGSLIAVIFFSVAYAEDWVPYARYPDLFFYDEENINTPDENNIDVIGIWQKIVYSDKSVARISEYLGNGYADLRESIALVEMNCFSKNTQTKAITYYNSKGEVIHTKHQVKDNWEEIQPSTHSQKLYKAVCPSRS
ncbi:MAG TPA: surface-adhesin E family protein [Thermodesulfovibrionales bacterium]|nr:surface-adhesin E family protein [Thermodesulfovibrionales bacterium]